MESYLENVKRVARIAGEEILKIYKRKSAKKFEKKDKSFVTDADIASERIICKEIKKYGYKILSEEGENIVKAKKGEFLWIIDPLDGTNDFIDRTGDFSVMIALIKNNKPLLGVVYNPVSDKMYFACKKKGAFLEEKGRIKELKTSDVSSLPESTLVASRTHFSLFEKELGDKIVKKSVRVGSVGLKIGLMSEGKAEVYVNTSNKTGKWDSAAPQIILEEAGGVMTDIRGSEIKYGGKEVKNLNGILAANNKKMHNLILKYYDKSARRKTY